LITPGQVEAGGWADFRCGTAMADPTVFVVDNDPSIRNALGDLFASVGPGA
jgi:hypothetical protein